MAASLIVGCGSKPSEKEAPLTFRHLDADDTAGIVRERSMLHEFQIERDPAGALRARGRIDLPDRTRLDLIVYSVEGGEVLGLTEFEVRDGRFESPPILGRGGRLPEAVYHFQLRGWFDAAIQPAEVMTAIDNGLALRGPGVTRGANGVVAFAHDRNLRR